MTAAESAKHLGPGGDDPVLLGAWNQGFHDGYKLARRGDLTWDAAYLGILSAGSRLACPRQSHPYPPEAQGPHRHAIDADGHVTRILGCSLCHRCANYWSASHAGWMAAGGPITGMLARNRQSIEQSLLARGWGRPEIGGAWSPPQGGAPDANG